MLFQAPDCQAILLASCAFPGSCMTASIRIRVLTSSRPTLFSSVLVVSREICRDNEKIRSIERQCLIAFLSTAAFTSLFQSIANALRSTLTWILFKEWCSHCLNYGHDFGYPEKYKTFYVSIFGFQSFRVWDLYRCPPNLFFLRETIGGQGPYLSLSFPCWKRIGPP